MQHHPQFSCITFLAAVCGVLALALPAAAWALPLTPSVIGLHSPSHPDTTHWYADSNPSFSWSSSASGGTTVDSYAYLLDRYSTTDPGTTGTAPALAFAAQQAYAVGTGPIAIDNADLNGDGHSDLLVANYNSGTVGVLLGKGDGVFAAQQAYTVGSQPWGITVADFNADGHPDLAVTNFGGGTVGVLLGRGDGSLTAQQTYKVGLHPEGIAAADFDGDGHTDLVVVNHGDGTTSGSIGVLLGQGNGGFASQQTYAVGVTPAVVAVADLNGDGHPDVVVTNFNDATVGVLLNSGGGSFAAQQTYPVGKGPAGIAVADLNGDGHPDLAVANHGDNTVGILGNNGDGSFAAQQTYPVGSGPQGVAVADLNGDGHPDLAVANRGEPTVSVLVGWGDGSFAAQQTFAVGNGSWRVAVADLNGDGHPDLAVANATDGTVSVLLDQAGMATFAGEPDGTWYFHVRARGSGGAWGDPSTLQVNIDTTPPATTAVTGLAADAHGGWQNTPQLVRLGASDSLSGPAATYYTLDGGAMQSYGGPFTISAEGAHTVSYWSVDKAGNVETAHTGYADIDTTAPTVTVSGANDGAWLNHAVTITITATDGVSGPASIDYTLDGLPHTVNAASTEVVLAVSPNATHTLIYSAIDAAGNASAARSFSVHIDTTPPATTAVTGLAADAHAGWQNTPQLVRLGASDSLSGPAATYYTLDGGAMQSYGGPFTISAEGAHTVSYWSVDKAGNVETAHTGYADIDTTAPETMQIGADTAWHAGPVKVGFDAADALSGVATTEYMVDDSAWTTGSSVTVSGDGDHVIAYRSTDIAGNVEARKTVHVKIDTAAPKVAVSSVDDLALWHNHAVTVTCSADDPQGIASIEYRLDDGAWATGSSVAVSGDGDHIIAFKATDAAGNVAGPIMASVKIETRKPATQAPRTARAVRGKSAALWFTIVDASPSAGTATATIKVKNRKGKVVKTLKLGVQPVDTALTAKLKVPLGWKAGAYRFFVFATDAAGNTQANVASNRVVVK